MSETSLTLTIELELHTQFLAEADAVQRPASEVLRDLMAAFVARQREARDYDTWFRAEVEEGLRELDDPNAELMSHEQVMAEMDVYLANLAKGTKAA